MTGTMILMLLLIAVAVVALSLVLVFLLSELHRSKRKGGRDND